MSGLLRRVGGAISHGLEGLARVPAPAAMGVFFALGAGLVLLDLRESAPAILLLLAWAAYCIARPTVGLVLFFLPAVQSLVAQAGDWANDGAYWWVYGALVPLALYAAHEDDRPAGGQSEAPA